MAEEEERTRPRPPEEPPPPEPRRLSPLEKGLWLAVALALVGAGAAVRQIRTNEISLRAAPTLPIESASEASATGGSGETPGGGGDSGGSSAGPRQAAADEGEEDQSSDDEGARREALALARLILEAGREAGESGPTACLAQTDMVLQTWPVCVCLAEAALTGREKRPAILTLDTPPRVSPRGTLDWEFAFSGARAAHILESWRAALGAERLEETVSRSLSLDRWLIVAYFVGFTALCVLGLWAFPAGKQTLWLVICCLPLAAGVLDVVENQALRRQLDHVVQAVPAADAGVAASLKFALLGITVLALILVGVAWLGKWMAWPRTHKKIGEDQVLADERSYLQGRRRLAGIKRNHAVGLALSGGGLRSATISLGALQALAREKVLPKFDYLSTVSGGGYIGSALSSLLSINASRIGSAAHHSPAQFQFGPTDSAWFSTEPDRVPFDPDNEAAKRRAGGYRFPFNPDNEATMQRAGGFGGGTQMRHLRAAGKFLIPKSNPLSIAMLRVIGGVLAGILHHVVHFGFLMVSISAAYLAVIYWMVGPWATRNPPLSADDVEVTRLLDRYAGFVKEAFGYEYPGEWWTHPFFISAVVGFVAMALILRLWQPLAGRIHPGWFERPGDTLDGNRNQTVVLAMIVAMPLLGFGVLTTWFAAGDKALLNVCIPLFSYLGGGLWLGGEHAAVKINTSLRRTHRSRVAAQEGAFVTLTVVSLILVLLVLPFLVFFDEVAEELESRPLRSLFGWILTLLGARAFAGDEEGKGAKGVIGRAVDFIPGLRKFLLSTLVVLATLGAALLICVLIWRHEPAGHPLGTRAAIVAVALLAWWSTGWFNFNRLALHTFYRDRLTEAFLRTTAADPKSGNALVPLREGEYMQVQDLHGRGAGGRAGTCVTSAPYHLIVSCLNLTGASHFARQATRRTDQFIFSKLYCGSATSGFEETARYRGGKTRLSHAMTISGAAASPAMGKLSFFGQSLAMTLFNVRLGQWMENPSWARGTGRKRTFWPYWLIREIFASSDADKRLLYLSDGGHSGDNLGIYPLLKRRCRLIVAVDGEYDPECSGDSLVEGLRQISIDEGIDVRIDLRSLRPDPKTGHSKAHYVTGEINYPGNQKGWLVVVKSTLTDDEPEVVANYKRGSEEFPHETTGDLFFDDAQFEAYRRLGEHMVKTLLQSSAVCHAEL